MNQRGDASDTGTPPDGLDSATSVTLYDLWFDATTVDGQLEVTCWISHGPRAGDVSFDPRPGDAVVLGDDEEAPLHARVLARDGDRVTVQVVTDASALI